MENGNKDLNESEKKKSQVLTHLDPTENGVSESLCSTFIKKKNVLVMGEFLNPYQSKRNAMIILVNSESGDIVGWSRMSKVSNSKGED